MRLTSPLLFEAARTRIFVRRSRYAAALAAAVLALAPPGASAANHLQNGEFDGPGFAPWTAINNLVNSSAFRQAFGYADELRPAEGGVRVQEERHDAFNRFNDVRQCVSAAGLPVGTGTND